VEILARQGCSNGGIRIQIDEVLRQRPDFVIVNATGSDRMEIPASSVTYEPETNQYWSRNFAWWQNNHSGYDPKAGLDNINYNHNQSKLIVEAMWSLADNHTFTYRPKKLDTETNDAIKKYITYLYDPAWKKQQDQWIMRDGIMQLQLAGISFILSPIGLWHHDKKNADYIRNYFSDTIPNRCLIMKYEHSFKYVGDYYPIDSVGVDPGYHTNPEGQQYLADIFYNRITQDFGIEP
jgi:hypothetical protein